MKIDAALTSEVSTAPFSASDIEKMGYDGIWVSETQHDPFLLALRAADATKKVTVATAVAIAFGRTPLTVAHQGYDLATCSEGRFVLGLGSQVKPHIERRFSMPWSRPAARMREFVLALRAIWSAWENDTKLDFRGDFYTHTIMTPFFSPAVHEFGPPPVYLAAVGERMTEVAGEVCNGIFVHPFTTRSYFEEVTRAALRRGRETAGSTAQEGFEVCGLSFVAVGRNEHELETAIAATKQQIAFYASTPAYRPVLEHHGYGELQPELSELAKQGRWQEMGQAVEDGLLRLVAVSGDPVSVGRQLAERWGDTFDRVSFDAPYPVDAETLAEVAGTLGGRTSGE